MTERDMLGVCVREAELLSDRNISRDAPNSLHDLMRHYERMAEAFGSIHEAAKHKGNARTQHKANECEQQCWQIADAIRGVIGSIDKCQPDEMIGDVVLEWHRDTKKEYAA